MSVLLDLIVYCMHLWAKYWRSALIVAMLMILAFVCGWLLMPHPAVYWH